ncbi:MAG: hypothetical protein IJE07_09805 [Clostridia bacterium]|nr:hypothetical protein [Clostridia bacterium]
MNAKAIVYVSNTGYTARYATILFQKLGIPAHTLPDAQKTLPAGTPIIYMGWLMAGSVKDYKKAAKRFAVEAVIGVSLGDTGAQDEAARKACRLPADVPVFTVQGGMDVTKLRGPYKLAIRMLTKAMAAKKDATPGEARMAELLLSGGDFVSEKELTAVLAWAGKE